MEITNEYLLGLYEQRVRNLGDADESGTDEELALITRDFVAERDWSARDVLAIERIDTQLLKHWSQFEGVFPTRQPHDRTHWWWFLHEGPQVREEARRLAEGDKAEHAVV